MGFLKASLSGEAPTPREALEALAMSVDEGALPVGTTIVKLRRETIAAFGKQPSYLGWRASIEFQSPVAREVAASAVGWALLPSHEGRIARLTREARAALNDVDADGETRRPRWEAAAAALAKAVIEAAS